jgi:hypothetical protein
MAYLPENCTGHVETDRCHPRYIEVPETLFSPNTSTPPI